MKTALPLLGVGFGLVIGYFVAINTQPKEYDVELLMQTSNVIGAAHNQDKLMDIAESGIHSRCRLMERIQFNHDSLVQTDRNYLVGKAKDHALHMLDKITERYQSDAIQSELSRC